jgi:hypothetical protein
VVAAKANIAAGIPLGAALTDQDIAGDNDFAAKLLNAEPPAFGIAPVAG